MKRIYWLIIILVFVLAYFFLPNVFLKSKYDLNYSNQIKNQAEKNDLAPTLVASVIYNESRYQPEAVSDKKAIGLMQIQLPTAKHVVGKKINQEDLYRPQTNIKIGCQYLKELVDKYEDLKLALIAYNLGPTQLDKELEEGTKLNRLTDSYQFAHKVIKIEKVYQTLYYNQLNQDKADVSTLSRWLMLTY